MHLEMDNYVHGNQKEKFYNTHIYLQEVAVVMFFQVMYSKGTHLKRVFS